MFNKVAAGGAVIVLAGAFGAMATAQTPQDTSALLSEVRLMRQSIDRMAGNHLRVQLLFGRMQSQQLPLARAAMTLQTARAQLASVTVRYQDMHDQIIQLESMSNETAEDIENLQREGRALRAESARLENERSSLLLAEAEAARQDAEEQARMEALHSEIEDLGRTLLAPIR